VEKGTQFSADFGLLDEHHTLRTFSFDIFLDIRVQNKYITIYFGPSRKNDHKSLVGDIKKHTTETTTT